MPAKRYRKRQVEVEAVQFDGGEFPLDFLRDDEKVEFDGDSYNWIRAEGREPVFVEPGYVVVREANGTLTTWPDATLFQATYEPVEGDPALLRERAVDLLLDLAKIADDDAMCLQLEALASRFSLPPSEQQSAEGEGDGHRIEIEFDGFPPSIRLIHPERGCPRGEEGDDCWLTDWLENEGSELLRGKLALPVRWEAPADRDHPLLPRARYLTPIERNRP